MSNTKEEISHSSLGEPILGEEAWQIIEVANPMLYDFYRALFEDEGVYGIQIDSDYKESMMSDVRLEIGRLGSAAAWRLGERQYPRLSKMALVPLRKPPSPCGEKKIAFNPHNRRLSNSFAFNIFAEIGRQTAKLPDDISTALFFTFACGEAERGFCEELAGKEPRIIELNGGVFVSKRVGDSTVMSLTSFCMNDVVLPPGCICDPNYPLEPTRVSTPLRLSAFAFPSSEAASPFFGSITPDDEAYGNFKKLQQRC